MTSNEDRLTALLGELGMKLEIVKGVSGVTIGYSISKVFYNRSDAAAWVKDMKQLHDARAKERCKS